MSRSVCQLWRREPSSSCRTSDPGVATLCEARLDTLQQLRQASLKALSLPRMGQVRNGGVVTLKVATSSQGECLQTYWLLEGSMHCSICATMPTCCWQHQLASPRRQTWTNQLHKQLAYHYRLSRGRGGGGWYAPWYGAAVLLSAANYTTKRMVY